MTRYLDIHVLQTVPPSCINRDDTGSPKTAVYGGVRRARVSSQAWKRATRRAFEGSYDKAELGVRTKRLVELLSDEIRDQASDLAEAADEIAADVIKETGIKLTAPKKKADGDVPAAESGYLVFLSRSQVRRLAAEGVRAQRAGGSKQLVRRAVQSIVKENNSIDVALFGRMIADVADLNVDAACQVAHAISTHGVDQEFDFFTAVDDHKSADREEDAGAGMMGTVEFNSSTLYRYATVNLELLTENLGDEEAMLRAAAAFIDAFATSMPTGKQTTFANRTLPELVYLALRSDQPVSLVGAFEKPVPPADEGGFTLSSSRLLAQFAADVDKAFGRPAVRSWHAGVGAAGDLWDGGASERVSFVELGDAVRAALTARERVAT